MHPGIDKILAPSIETLFRQDKDGDTLFHILAAKNPDSIPADDLKTWQIADDFLKTISLHIKGPLLSMRNKLGQSALHVAVHNQHEAMIRFLVTHRALIEQQDNKGHTPLHSACLHKSTKTLRLLLHLATLTPDFNRAIKTAINIKSFERGLPCLLLYITTHNPAEPDCLEMVDLLIKAGSDLKQIDNTNGMTLLQIAADQRNAVLYQYLNNREQYPEVPDPAKPRFDRYKLYFSARHNLFIFYRQRRDDGHLFDLGTSGLYKYFVSKRLKPGDKLGVLGTALQLSEQAKDGHIEISVIDPTDACTVSHDEQQRLLELFPSISRISCR